MRTDLISAQPVAAPSLDLADRDASNMLSRLRRSNRALDRLRHMLELDEAAADAETDLKYSDVA